MSLGVALGCLTTGKRVAAIAITGPALLYSANLVGGTDNSRLKLYNSTAASGTIVWELANAGGTNVGDVKDLVSFVKPIVCPNGIYCDVAGTSAEFEVSYQPY